MRVRACRKFRSARTLTPALSRREREPKPRKEDKNATFTINGLLHVL